MTLLVDLIDRLEHQIKHMPGRHDQKKHDPHSGRSAAPEVEPDAEYYSKFLSGNMNNRVYHITIQDHLPDIVENGLIPGASPAIAQSWKAKHSDYATYFHSDEDAAVLNAKHIEDLVGTKPPMVIMQIPVTEEGARRVLPDEDVYLDTNKGLQALDETASIAVIGGAKPEEIWGFRIDPDDPHLDPNIIDRMYENGYEVELYS